MLRAAASIPPNGGADGESDGTEHQRMPLENIGELASSPPTQVARGRRGIARSPADAHSRPPGHV
jgi:hypothetical protein